MYGSYSSQVSREGRLLFPSIIIQIINWIGFVTENVINKSASVYPGMNFSATQ